MGAVLALPHLLNGGDRLAAEERVGAVLEEGADAGAAFPIDFESEPGANRSKKLPSLAERTTVHELNGTMRPTTRRPAPAPRGFVQEPNERRSERGELGATLGLPCPRPEQPCGSD